MRSPILVVDDEQPVREYIAELLRDRGYSVKALGSAASARRFFADEPPPSLLVLDRGLLDGDGLELIADARLHYGPQAPPALVLSGLRGEADILRGYAAGADDYLTKPFKPAEFYAKVSLLLARRGAPTNLDATIKLPRREGLVFGRYQTGRVLGRGQSGLVYAARDTVLHQPVALKVLSAIRGRDAEFRYRFLREAYVLASLRHPNLVRVHDFGAEEGRIYFAMELVAGPTLQDSVDTRPLDPPRVLRLLTALADVLATLHEAHIVHRHLTPRSVILRGADASCPVLVDFGSSKRVVERGITTYVAGPEQHGYVAPEVEHGEPADHRSDLYSLGRLALFALHGTPKADVPATGDLGPILTRLLAEEPDRRYQVTGELVAELRAAEADACR